VQHRVERGHPKSFSSSKSTVGISDSDLARYDAAQTSSEIVDLCRGLLSVATPQELDEQLVASGREPASRRVKRLFRAEYRNAYGCEFDTSADAED